MSHAPIVNPRPALQAKLTKEPFSIPNLKPYYKAWPTAVNPHYPQLKPALEARIKEYVEFAVRPVEHSIKLTLNLRGQTVSIPPRRQLN